MFHREQQKTKSKAILSVHLFLKDGDEFLCQCPHCAKIIGLLCEDEECELESICGEQYQCRCDGWLEVSDDARLTRSIDEIDAQPCEPFKLYDCDDGYEEQENE